jgi:hypothetical protein
MSLESKNSPLQLPDGMKSKLEDFRRRVWRIKLAEGILAAAFGLVVSFLVVFCLDRIWETPKLVRTLILIGGSLGLGLFFPLKMHRWVWQTRQLEQVARLLRFKFPRLSDHLLGIIELVHAEGQLGGSVELAQAALKQVDKETSDIDFTGAVPDPKHRRWAWAVGVPAVVAILVLGILPAAGFNAFGRWLMPWSDTPRYTFAQLENLPDELIVPFSEPFELKAQLSKDTAWTPETGTAQYRKQRPIKSKLANNGYGFKIPPQKVEGQLRLAIGDARKSITVKPTTRPELKSMIARVKLPAYLEREGELTRDVRGGSISLVKGSEAVFEAEASRELAVAKVNGEEQEVNGKTLRTRPIHVTKSMNKEFTWRDELGLSAKTPFVLRILGQDDQAPTVIAKTIEREIVLLETETLRFDAESNDDFGIKKMGLEWYGVADAIQNPNPANGEKVIAAGGPDQLDVQGVTTFSPQREGVKPQILKMRMYAEDYMPDRKRSYSTTYTVYVLSPAEHAVWLTNQMRRWFQKTQESFEKEQQLYEENQRIRRLTDEEIDKPETRRRIESQASAEQANGRRLATLTEAGEELVKQATRNEEFNVETLETLAAQLQVLKDIAENRMPSVYDLLKDAANAPGGKKGGKPGKGKPGEGKPGKSGKPGDGKGKAGEGQPSDGKPGKSGENKGDSKSDSKVKNSGEQKPGEASDSESNSETKSVGNNRNQQGGKSDPKESPPSKLPSISDVESGFNKTPEPKEKLDDEKQQGGAGKFGLPGTTLIGGGDDDDEDAASCPAAKKLDKAIEAQENLLDEFAKVSDELQRILDNLEGSTFVKRLKAASRRQLVVAKDLNTRLLGAFGVTSGKLKENDQKFAKRVAERELTESDTIYIIQEDLEAYFNRVNDGKFKTILEEMKDIRVVTKVKEMGDSVKDNLNGQTIAEAEFWSDNLDRWAEQLVGPG